MTQVQPLKYKGDKHDNTKPETYFQYAEDDLLTAPDYNDVPNKVNEIINSFGADLEFIDTKLFDFTRDINTINTNIENIGGDVTIINNDITEINNEISNIKDSLTGSESLNISCTVDLANTSVSGIKSSDELRLKYNDDGELYIEKYQPLQVSMSVTPDTFEIDAGNQNVTIKISKSEGTDNIDTNTIQITSDYGTITGSGLNYTLVTNQNTTITATVNSITLPAKTVKFNKKQTACWRSENILTIANLTTSNSTGFNINQTNLLNYKTNNYVTDEFTCNAVTNKMTYMYFITTKQYTTPEQIKQHMFRNGSSIGGGFVYVGTMNQYSTNVGYYVYRTTDKYDTTITVNIR